MTKTEYRNYISSEKWQRRRKEFLRANSSCNECGVSRKRAIETYDQDLHVHHKNYQRVGHELDSDLEPLCLRCHEVETFGDSELPYASEGCRKCSVVGVRMKGNYCIPCFDWVQSLITWNSKPEFNKEENVGPVQDGEGRMKFLFWD
jgi:hypothetical protein